MLQINWNEYKEYRKYSSKKDKLQLAIDFMRSYYNMNSPIDIYDALAFDDIGKMLLDKRDIVDAEGLETFMFKL